MDLLAVADVAKLAQQIDPYRSSLERSWAEIGPALLADEFGAPPVLSLYEPTTFRLPGLRYTPDFMAILEDGRIIFVEIKASRRQKNYRAARQALRVAAHCHPWATWIEARADKDGGWTLEPISG